MVSQRGRGWMGIRALGGGLVFRASGGIGDGVLSVLAPHPSGLAHARNDTVNTIKNYFKFRVIPG